MTPAAVIAAMVMAVHMGPGGLRNAGVRRIIPR